MYQLSGYFKYLLRIIELFNLWNRCQSAFLVPFCVNVGYRFQVLDRNCKLKQHSVD